MLPTIGNATLCGDRRGRGAKTRGFFAFFVARATLCGDRHGRGAKTRGFLCFLICPRNPLRSRCRNSRSSAEIGVVEVQKLEVVCIFCGARATLCGDRRCQSGLLRFFAGTGVVEVQKLEGFLRFFCFCFFFCPRCPRDPLRRSCVSKRSRRTLCGDRACGSALAVAPCDFVAREMAFGSCLVVCAPAFAIPRSRVRFPPGPRQLRLENRSF